MTKTQVTHDSFGDKDTGPGFTRLGWKPSFASKSLLQGKAPVRTQFFSFEKEMIGTGCAEPITGQSIAAVIRMLTIPGQFAVSQGSQRQNDPVLCFSICFGEADLFVVVVK